ncbi:MAG: hypothetical protein AAF357_19800, partial [Verrucomicrobiota bacterium]
SDAAWNVHSDILYDVVANTDGSSPERVAFYFRVLSSPGGEQVAITKPAKFSNSLHQQWKAEGGPDAMEATLDVVFGELWENCGRSGSPAVFADLCTTFVNRFEVEEMPAVIAWADRRASLDDDFAPVANHLALAWRMTLDKNPPNRSEAILKTIPRLGEWTDHFIAVMRDESIPYSQLTSVGAGPVTSTRPEEHREVILVGAEMMANALSADAAFNGWRYVNFIKSFNQVHEEGDEEWTRIAQMMHEGWKHKNRNNHREYITGLSWNPWDDVVLLTLEMHTLLADEEKLAVFLKEKNAQSQLEDDARTLLPLVSQGFFDEANRFLRVASDEFDPGRDFYDTTYAPKYSGLFHQRLEAYLPTIESEALRHFAEALFNNLPDVDPKRRSEDESFPLRHQRVTETVKRFQEIDFEGEEELREDCLRVYSQVDSTAWYLRKELAELGEDTDLGAILSSQNYTYITLGMRIPSAFAVNEARRGNEEPLRKLIAELNESGAEDYFRGEALEVLAVRFADSVR